MSVYLFVSVILLGVAVLLSLFLKQSSHPEYIPVHHTERHSKDEIALKPGTQLIFTETN